MSFRFLTADARNPASLGEIWAAWADTRWQFSTCVQSPSFLSAQPHSGQYRSLNGGYWPVYMCRRVEDGQTMRLAEDVQHRCACASTFSLVFQERRCVIQARILAADAWPTASESRAAPVHNQPSPRRCRHLRQTTRGHTCALSASLAGLGATGDHSQPGCS